MRLEVIQKLLICRRSGVVELVHDDEIVEILADSLSKRAGVQSLHRNKQIIQRIRTMFANEQFAEIRVVKYPAEAFYALFKDFLAVRYEQQAAGLTCVFAAESAIIERGNYSFACAGRGNDKIAEMPADIALGFQAVEYLLLIGIGVDVKEVIRCFAAVFFG